MNKLLELLFINSFKGIGKKTIHRKYIDAIWRCEDIYDLIGTYLPMIKVFSNADIDQAKTTAQRHIEELEEMLELADDLSMPVNIHDREAHGDTLAILKKEGKGLCGVLHCFSGSLEFAREALKLDWLIGVDGPLTFKNAAKLPEIVKQLPLESILIETDSPYMAPVPMRGKRNEPAYVRYVAEKLAELRGEPFEKIASVTTKNAERLYKMRK